MSTLYDGNGNTIEVGGSGGLASVKAKEFGVYANDPKIKSQEENELRNTCKFPLLATWGNEYLNGWYKKLFYGQHVTIAVDGDSTTEEAYGYMGRGRRAQIVEQLMKVGAHPNFTVHKNGYGSRASGDYVGSYYSSSLMPNMDGVIPTPQSHPNGLLADTIAQDPDLIIFGYGLNDVNRFKPNTPGAKWPPSEDLDLQGRLDLFGANIEEFLKRLRGAVGTTVNGRECYGRDEYETAVILCVPIARGTTEELKDWSYYSRSMIQKLCRKYHCGFFDPTSVNYDHEWSQKWSWNSDGTHPAPQTNADFVSTLQPLLYPMGLWFTKDEDLFTVTYHIDHCTLSYQPDHLREGVKLETTITADEGYTINGVTITQNGQSAGSYNPSNGSIQLIGVSGDVEITATVTAS